MSACCNNLFLTLLVHIKLYWIGTVYLVKELFSRHRRMQEIPRRDGEIAVITGGNRGIGWETVKRLVEAGMHVIVGCRDGASKDLLFQRVEESGLPRSSVEWIALDMSSLESVRAFSQKILDKNRPISLLINNAGIMFVPYEETKEGFESHFVVNYLGHFLLTHLLMPQLKAAAKSGRAARVVNLSSSAHAMGWMNLDDLQAKKYYSPVFAYSQSKLSQVMFTEYLDARLASENVPVHIYALHPGVVKSNLYTRAWYSKFLLATAGWAFKTETQGADTSLFAALSPEAENLRGKYFENSCVAIPIAKARDLQKQQKLWDISCNLLNIKEFGTA